MIGKHTMLLPSFDAWKKNLAVLDYTHSSKVKIAKPEMIHLSRGIYRQFLEPLLEKLKPEEVTPDTRPTYTRFFMEQDFVVRNRGLKQYKRNWYKAIEFDGDSTPWFSPFEIYYTGVDFQTTVRHAYFQSKEGLQVPRDDDREIALGSFNYAQLGYAGLKKALDKILTDLAPYIGERFQYFQEQTQDYRQLSPCIVFMPSEDDILLLRNRSLEKVFELNLVLGCQQSFIYNDTNEVDQCLSMPFKLVL